MTDATQMLESPLEAEREERGLARHGRGSLLARGMIAAAALFGLAVFVRELPDLRRYLRIERM